MKKLILLTLIFKLLFSCSNEKKEYEKKEVQIENKKKEIKIEDRGVIIGKKDVTNEVFGLGELKKATSYFTIIKNDSSSFSPIVVKYKKNGDLAIKQNLSYVKRNKPYSQRLNEFKMILAEAAKEYNFDSLKKILMGRLMLSGDLAITVTEEYKKTKKNKEKITIADYQDVLDFVLKSRLTKDLNELLKPYSKSVSKMHLDKVLFTSKSQLLIHSEISKDSTKIPNKILDFLAVIELIDVKKSY